MFRRAAVLRILQTRSECDAVRGDKIVRMKLVPNPVSSYTTLPFSCKAALGFGDSQEESEYNDRRRQLMRDLLRKGEAEQRTAGSLLEQLRKEHATKSLSLRGPIDIEIIARGGETRKIATYVNFANEPEEATPLGKSARLGLTDLQKLGVTYNYLTNHITFDQPQLTQQVSQAVDIDGKPLSPELDQSPNENRLPASERGLAASMIPDRPPIIEAPVVNPESPLSYTD